MSAYVRTTTVDSSPSGASVIQAILDLDTDLTGHVAAYNAHDTATTSVHGFTGTKTGSGAMVGATSPTLVTPVLGVATATSINKVALTAPATSCTLTIANGKTLTCSNTLTFAGTDSTTITFPSTSCTVARTDAANSFTGTQTITKIDLASGQIKFPAAQSASADANTLDDYEEGTWTPLDSSDNTIGAGYYVKIGRIVFIYLIINTNSVSTQSVKGLPFTVASGYSGLYWGHIQGTDIIDADGSPCCTYITGTTLTFRKLDGSTTNHTLTTIPTGNIRTTLQGLYLV